MMHLANNYSYRFIKDDTNVFTISKNPECHRLPIAKKNVNKPVRNYKHHFYSEPYMNSQGHVNNSLLAFTSKDNCLIWQMKIKRMNKIFAGNTSHQFEELDKSDEILSSHAILEVSLYDIKVISDAMQMPLIVILDSKDEQYDVYFHHIKQKQRNG